MKCVLRVFRNSVVLTAATVTVFTRDLFGHEGIHRHARRTQEWDDHKERSREKSIKQQKTKTNWHAAGGSCDDVCFFCSCDENKMAKARLNDTCGQIMSTKSAIYLFNAEIKENKYCRRKKTHTHGMTYLTMNDGNIF